MLILLLDTVLGIVLPDGSLMLVIILVLTFVLLLTSQIIQLGNVSINVQLDRVCLDPNTIILAFSIVYKALMLLFKANNAW